MVRVFRTFTLLFTILLMIPVLSYSLQRFYRSAYPMGYYDTVMQQSHLQEVDPALVFAVIRTESNFRPGVQSSVGARGLMQITEETFDWVAWRSGYTGDSYEDLYDPQVNIRYGTALLRLLTDEFGSQINALAAYHAGWGSVTRWLDDPKHTLDGETLRSIPFGDTARYVRKVEATKEIYHNLYSL